MPSEKSLVIVPTYNEAENIQPLAERILALPSKFDLLVIDDNSPDGTAGILKKHAAFPTRIHVIERPGKLGLGTAYCEGFRWALDRSYFLICQMDADFSHDPDDLERLRSACERSPIVIGSRYIPGGRVEGWAKHRELLSRAANVYARVFTRVPVHDLTGGFKCFRAEALRALPLGEIRSEGYAFQIETTTRLFRAGFPPVEVPIVFRERRFGTSKISRNVVFEAIGVVLRLAFK